MAATAPLIATSSSPPAMRLDRLSTWLRLMRGSQPPSPLKTPTQWFSESIILKRVAQEYYNRVTVNAAIQGTTSSTYDALEPTTDDLTGLVRKPPTEALSESLRARLAFQPETTPVGGAVTQLWNAVLDSLDFQNIECTTYDAGCNPGGGDTLMKDMSRAMLSKYKRIPEFCMQYVAAQTLARELAFTMACPCFAVPVDHGFLLSASSASSCGDLAQYSAAISNMYMPAFAAVGGATCYSLDERAAETVADVLRRLRDDGQRMCDLLSSVLSQVCMALVAAREATGFIHGDLSVRTVKLKRLPAFANRDWFFCASKRWKRIGHAQHQGYLVLMTNFTRSAMLSANGGGVASVSEPATMALGEDGGSSPAPYVYDLGCFCWSLMTQIDGRMITAMRAATGEFAEDILRFLDTNANSVHLHNMLYDFDSQKIIDDVAQYVGLPSDEDESSAYRFFVASAFRALSAGGRRRDFLRNIMELRVFPRPGDDAATVSPLYVRAMDDLVAWMTIRLLPHHADDVARRHAALAPPEPGAGPAAKRERLYAPRRLDFDASLLFAQHDHIKVPSAPVHWHQLC